MQTQISANLVIIVIVLGLATASFASEPDVTIKSLLKEMTDFGAVARWASPEFTMHQCSSYDRAEVAPDQPGWFANNDFSQYLREEDRNGRVEHVMMDANGPGCIVRFWLTTVKNKKGTLRIYLDGHTEPMIVFPAYDLLSGDLKVGEPLDQPHPGYSPADNGGNTLRLPIPYAQHCKVTWEEAGEGPRYYQINYRTYAPGTAVKTFSLDEVAKARSLIMETGKKLMSPPDTARGRVIVTWSKPFSGRRKRRAGFAGRPGRPAEPGAVDTDLIKSHVSERALRSVIVQMNFDGEETVWCPASDFFGSGVGINPLQSWYRTVTADGSMVCRWVMPYARSARLTIANIGGLPVTASAKACVGDWKWDKRSMHFHSAWHYEADLTTPPARDWNFVRITGRGVYVGDTLALYNFVPTWYGEGDEKIRVDNEVFPSFLGTGTEDYYDFSFAPRGIMQTPFANQMRVDQPMTQGHNVLTRTRNLDGIPFSQSLDFNIELISWKPTKLIYAATSYWYAFPGAASNIHPQPDAARLAVPTLADAQKQQLFLK